MAVVVVGDFDKATIEGLVKTHFGALPKTAVPRLRPTYKVPEHPTTLYALATDKEYPATSVGVIKKYPERDRTTLGGYRQTLRRTAVHVDVRPPDERDRPEGRPAVPRRRRRARAGRHRQDRRRVAQRLREGDWRRARPGGRADRVGAGAQVRVHADRTRPAEARHAPRPTSGGSRSARSGNRRRSPTSTSATSPTRRSSPASSTSTPRASGSCPRSRSTRSTRWRRSSAAPPTAW